VLDKLGAKHVKQGLIFREKYKSPLLKTLLTIMIGFHHANSKIRINCDRNDANTVKAYSIKIQQATLSEKVFLTHL